jgi:antitoxin YefM
MRQMAVHEFRNILKAAVEKVIQDHEPLRVTRRSEEAFIVISEADWQREQETLHVLQNQSLMQQIAESLATHRASQGYTPTPEELNEITGI